MVVQLTVNHMNRIKRLSSLAVSSSTAFLSATATAITDTSGNFLTVRAATAALGVTNLVLDSGRPSVDSFSFDGNSGELTLTFSETVNVSSIRVGEITLQSTASSTAVSRSLTSGSVVEHSNADTVVITLSQADRDALKGQSVCSGTSSCFLSFSNDTILDMVGRCVAARSSASALSTSVVTDDNTGPQLLSFAILDLIQDQVTLSFYELVDLGTFLPEHIRLQSLFQNPLESFNLTDGVLVTTADSDVIVFNLTFPDLHAVKNKPNLCSRRSNCYLTATSQLVKDKSGNVFQAVVESYPGQIVTSLIDRRPTAGSV